MHHLEEMEDIIEDIILLDEGTVKLHTSIDNFRDYAIGITGERTKLQTWAQNKEIIYEENIGIDDLFIVINNEFDIEKLTAEGFEVTNVASSDLAVYLTNPRGGIDDVFRT